MGIKTVIEKPSDEEIKKIKKEVEEREEGKE